MTIRRVVSISRVEVPELLLDLVERGLWPADQTQADALENSYPAPPIGPRSSVAIEHLKDAPRSSLRPARPAPSIPIDRVRMINPKAMALHLIPPPFHTMRHASIYWAADYFAPEEIDLDNTIDIGDFGRGSDQPIILDYENDPLEALVRRLDFKLVRSVVDGVPNKFWDSHWIEIAPSFSEFAHLLGLS